MSIRRPTSKPAAKPLVLETFDSSLRNLQHRMTAGAATTSSTTTRPSSGGVEATATPSITATATKKSTTTTSSSSSSSTAALVAPQPPKSAGGGGRSTPQVNSTTTTTTVTAHSGLTLQRKNKIVVDAVTTNPNPKNIITTTTSTTASIAPAPPAPAAMSTEGAALLNRISNFDLFASAKQKKEQHNLDMSRQQQPHRRPHAPTIEYEQGAEVASPQNGALSAAAAAGATCGEVCDSGAGDGLIHNSPAAASQNKKKSDTMIFGQTAVPDDVMMPAAESPARVLIAKQRGEQQRRQSTNDQKQSPPQQKNSGAVGGDSPIDTSLPTRTDFDERNVQFDPSEPSPAAAATNGSQLPFKFKKEVTIKEMEVFAVELERVATSLDQFMYFDHLFQALSKQQQQ